jgi:hypothetical protein
MGDKANREVDNRTQNPGADEAREAASNLYAEVDLGQQIGTEAEYLRKAPGDLRRELGLRADASSEQVYRKMAQDMVRLWPQASPELKTEALATLGLQRGQVNEANVYNAFIARDRRETGTPATASLSELETAVHKRTYHQIKTGTLPIDVD